MQEVTEGQNLIGTKQPDIKTVQGYIRAASKIAIAAGHNDPRFLPLATDKVGQRIYVPLLEQVFDSVRKWTPPKRPERQPISFLILTDLAAQVGHATGAELLTAAAIRDAVIIGTFTGSRVSEYAQGQLRAGSKFQSVPFNAASGKQGGNPIAFMFSDFHFYSIERIELSPPAASKARYLQIRFRYCKGTARTFAYRLFSAMPSFPLCPVQAALRVIRRWCALQPGANTPLFCYFLAKQKSSVHFLSAKLVTQALRASAARVYPNPNHIVRQHIGSISSHSLRVFACLCLKTAGWKEDDISHRLRWDSDAVNFYIRQSCSQVDALSASLVSSSCLNGFSKPHTPAVSPKDAVQIS